MSKPSIRENHEDKGDLPPANYLHTFPPPNLTTTGIYVFIASQRGGKTTMCAAMQKSLMRTNPDYKPILLCPEIREQFSFIPKKQCFTNPLNFASNVKKLVKIQNQHYKKYGYNTNIGLIMDDIMGHAVFNTKEWKDTMNILAGSCRQPENNITVFLLVQNITAVPPAMRSNIYKLVVGDTTKEQCKKIASCNNVYNHKQLYNVVSTYCCNHQMLYFDNMNSNDCLLIKCNV